MKQEFLLRILPLCLVVTLLSLASTFVNAEDVEENPQIIVPCSNGIVQVPYIEIICDSPYTYYYGNGANRNSPVCDYGDKALVTVNFTVSIDLEEGEVIYGTFDIYTDDGDELLYSNGGYVDICQNYVGLEDNSCNMAGSYQFTKQVNLNSIDGGSNSKFVPLVKMSFSNVQLNQNDDEENQQDEEGAYILGGVNVDDCGELEENEDYYEDYINGGDDASGGGSSGARGAGAAGFFSSYGILLVTIALLGIFAFLLRRNVDGGSRIEQQPLDEDPDPRAFELMQR